MLSTEDSVTNGSPSEVGTTKDVVENTEPCSNSDENSLTNEKTGNEADQSEMAVDEDGSISETLASLEHGKHLLTVNDYSSAAEVLLDVCCKCCQVYGDLADECGDPYFYYGCALLELAMAAKRMVRSHIKGNKTKKSEECSDADEAEGDEEESGHDNDASHVDNSESHIDPSINEPSVGEAVQSENDVHEGEMVPVDNISNGQLAWEMFELAKVIYTRQNDEKKLMDTYSKLSSADMFLGNYASAVKNSQKCLALHEKQSNPGEREVAETLFQLGTACSLSKEYYSAVKYFTSAGVVFERHIRHLLKNSESYSDSADSESMLDKIYDQVDEIRGLLQNIKDKICDVEELIRESMKSDSQTTNGVMSKNISNGAAPQSNGTLPASTVSETRANVISNLLRRKRKLIVNNGNEPKKPRLETV